MKIAIVEDLADERKSLHSLILAYFNSYQKRYFVTPEIFEFKNGETFLENYRPGTYDIVFLDIYMSQLTGIDVAAKIAALDIQCNIIFITTSTEHIIEGYDVNAVGYILKPLANHIPSLYKAINRVMDKLNLDQASITIPTKLGNLPILYRNIVYLDCLTRSLLLHTVSDTLRVTSIYKDFSKILLADNRFLECYRNLVVNMDFIEVVWENNFKLKTGEQIPISRRKKVTVIEQYMTYFIERKNY